MVQELNRIPWPGWEKVKAIGEGAFGTVYEIRHDLIHSEERAALKVLSIPRSQGVIKSMRAEGQDEASITQSIMDQAGSIVEEYNNMRRLEDAPNIVRCSGVYLEPHSDGFGYRIYIMMELLTPLLDRIQDIVWNEAQVIHLGTDLCRALAACERKGILHRDIKPENVFVAQDGTFKLGDFGIARTCDHTTYATRGVGTPSYMAPEIARGEEYNKRADIYSLGILLYWLLNRRRTPFLPLPPAGIQDTDRENAFRQRCRGDAIPEPLDGSRELKEAVLKACAFDPKDRYASAEEMLRALDSIAVNPAGEKTVGMAFGQFEDDGTKGEVQKLFTLDPEEDTGILLKEKGSGDPKLPEKKDGKGKRIALWCGIALVALTGAMLLGIGIGRKPAGPPETAETTQAPEQTKPPATEPPATEPPATEPPATEPPATEPPATEPPATEPPATEPPATEPPATEPPATKPPATEPPATEPPATEPPATEPPATEPPTTEPPATEPPATEPPATEPPATEPPTTEPPTTEPPQEQGKAPGSYTIRLSPREVILFQTFTVTVTPDVSDYTKIVIHAVDPKGGRWDFTIMNGNSYNLLVDRMDLVGTWTIYADVYNDFGVLSGAASGPAASLEVHPLPI